MNVYEKYQVKRVINASGKMTILGGSRQDQLVVQASNEGAENFFVIKDLKARLEAELAKHIAVPDVCIVNSASGGICQCVAASIAKDRRDLILNPYREDISQREVVIAKGHIVDYGTPISVPIMMGGGVICEAGYANACTVADMEDCINENTACLLYVKSHHCVQKGMPTVPEVADLANRYQIPLIIDAAAEEDLTKYLLPGVSAVIYSGTKALAAPTSGLVVGQGPLMSWLKQQSAGIGRVMKVGKESMLGLAQAVEQYLQKPVASLAMQSARLAPFNGRLSRLAGVTASSVQDDAGRAIMRSRIHFDQRYCVNAILEQLKQGNPAIYTRDYRANLGDIEIDIRDVSAAELEEIAQRICAIVEGM